MARFGKVWRLVHDISGRNKANAGKIGGATEEEGVKTGHNHFENILGKPPNFFKILIDLPTKTLSHPIDDSELTMEEYRQYIKK